MKKSKFFVVVLTILGGLFFNSVNTMAFEADEVDSVMTITPPQQKIILLPGDTFKGSITVSSPHLAKTDLKYSVTVGSFGLTMDEAGNLDYNDVDVDTITSYNQIMHWIKLEKNSGTVSPNSEDVIPFTIEVPQDAPAGGQYATIIVQNETDEDNSNDIAVKMKVRFASSIIAEVAGATDNSGEILDNSIPLISFSTPLKVSSLVRNNGNVHADAEYILQVYSALSGAEVYSNEDKPITSLIMPESERYNIQEWKGAPMIGIFKVRQTVSIFGDVSVVEKIVVLCPLWLLFVIIAAILFVIFWIISKSKSRKKS